jgi:hypothetical protein
MGKDIRVFDLSNFTDIVEFDEGFYEINDELTIDDYCRHNIFN